MRSPRILMINDHIHFGGGGDAVFRLEREAYERAGYDVYTFSQATARPADATERDTVHLESRSRALRRMRKFVGHPGLARTLRDFVGTVQPDLVRVHLVSKYPLAVYAALRGRRAVQTLHGPSLLCATSWGNLRRDSTPCELGIGMKCWRRRCMPLTGALLYAHMNVGVSSRLRTSVDWFHCPSVQIQSRAEALGYTPTRYIPHGIDEPFVACEPATHDGLPVVLYVGALAEQKGVMYLPPALEIIRSAVPGVRLVLVGRGACEVPLRREFERRGLTEHVEFRGFVAHEDMVAVYRSAQVLVMPSIWWEQFGLVGPEAMACGVPCVASNVGGIPEWLADGERGFLVPPRDAEALAERVIRLLEDRAHRLQFGAAGIAYARRVHDPAKYQQVWLDVVKERLADRPGD